MRIGKTIVSETQDIRLSQNQVEAITYIEQAYFVHGSIPTDDVLADTLGVTKTTVAKWWNSDDFVKVLNHKGLPVSERLTGKKTEVLSAQQLAVANMMLNLQDRRSTREKLESVGVTPQKYQVWRRDPTFMEYMKKRAESLYTNGDDSAYLNLMKNVEGGDLNAAKLFFEMRNIYNPKVSVELNVDMVLVRVIEIIQKHVKDPAILEAIAWELESLGGGAQSRETAASHVIEAQAVPVETDRPKPISLSL